MKVTMAQVKAARIRRQAAVQERSAADTALIELVVNAVESGEWESWEDRRALFAESGLDGAEIAYNLRKRGLDATIPGSLSGP